MDAKGTLKAITIELRHVLEGSYDTGETWQPGDLERRLASIGIRRDRPPVRVDELTLSPEDREARRVLDAFIESRLGAGASREEAFTEFVREAAYTWANRLLALRCMEARGLIDEVVLQKEAYGGRSLQHQRLARKEPTRCSGEDEGLFATLFEEFARRAKELPLLFDPKAAEVALRPSVAGLKRLYALLSGTVAVKGQDVATDQAFTAPDALGWAYQYWNTEEKERVFEKVRTRKGSKIEGADIIPATCIYTEPYMVKFLVQNSLGATWMGMHPDSRLCEGWEYYVRDADRAPVSKKAVADITFLDPACGSGHFLIEAFDLLYSMYLDEGAITVPKDICASILERNLFGIDIDGRAVQIAALALVMKAKEKALDFVPRHMNLVATDIRLPAGKEHLEAFLRKHPEDTPLKPALLTIFEGLAHANELGSLLQIEEPVERELHALEAKYRVSASTGEQQALWKEFQEPVQGKLPFGVASYEGWKDRTLERIREHFEAEAQGADLPAAFFGRAAGQGLSLVDLLSRRYDVVAANPPYMGSKNMGAIVKKHIESHFSSGRRDLYTAFILRCFELASAGSRVAMVMPQSWMFIRSFAELRAEAEGEGGVLRSTRIETIAQLGRHAFSEADPPSNVAMAPFAISPPRETHRLRCFRLSASMPAEAQAALLRGAVAGSEPSICFHPAQCRFLAIPQTPICYWLRERFFELLAGRTLGDVADVCQGLATADDVRFVRFVWEAPPVEWASPVRGRRWMPFEKGGGYGKWFGHHFWTVEWEHQGARIKASPTAVVRNEQHYFKEGWTYSFMARGSVGFRKYPAGTIFAAGASAGIIGMPRGFATAANCRFSSYVVRSINAKIQLNESYVARIPLPERCPDSWLSFESACAILKRFVAALDPTERSFGGFAVRGVSVADASRRIADESEAVAAVLHTLEALSEREVLEAYRIDGDDLQAVVDETGTPAGWSPLLSGHDALPSLPDAIALPRELLNALASTERRSLCAESLADLKRQLRALDEAGPGGTVDEDDEAAAAEDESDENEVAVSGARIPIPAESFLEELAQKLDVHPISVYWLLRELREKDGVICQPELRRFVEDYVSVLVLRLLGHRWPREVEAGDACPTWADRDGIIPLTEGAGEPTLLARVRERIAAEFGAERVTPIEREFEEIMGKPLGAWLASDFFGRHTSQFRKRPVAWHLTSSPSGKHRARRGGAVRNAPVYSCLLYYHRLDGDLLPKIRTQYVGPLRRSLQTELAGLERLQGRTADQDSRRLDLLERIDELKAFDERLEQVIISGFASGALDEVAAQEPLDKWTSRDGRSPHPSTRDAFLAQERRYDPDVNDGVRVNIAPLQRAGLLAADVLASKDIEQAIADRAAWRADERRWCREGKLPRPGWWNASRDVR